MPLPSDLQNFVETITLSNLSNLLAPTPTLVIPAGFSNLYVTIIQNNLTNDLGFSPDIQQLVKTLITSGEVTIISS